MLYHMKTATIRQVRHDLRTVLEWVAQGEEVTPDECQSVLAVLEADAKARTLVETPVSWAEVCTEAEALSAAHTAKPGIRATDVLHVAAAAIERMRQENRQFSEECTHKRIGPFLAGWPRGQPARNGGGGGNRTPVRPIAP